LLMNVPRRQSARGAQLDGCAAPVGAGKQKGPDPFGIRASV